MVPELRDHPDGFILADVDRVLGALLVRQGRTTVAVQDLEVDQMDVGGVKPPAGLVLNLPDLDVTEYYSRTHFGVLRRVVVKVLLG